VLIKKWGGAGVGVGSTPWGGGAGGGGGSAGEAGGGGLGVGGRGLWDGVLALEYPQGKSMEGSRLGLKATIDGGTR